MMGEEQMAIQETIKILNADKALDSDPTPDLWVIIQGIAIAWAIWLLCLRSCCGRRKSTRSQGTQTNPRITRNGWGVAYSSPSDPRLPLV